jgi:BirA family transcriptional regulator, biotin operon repressor / biotin---[acetyl-CoA-carboxylase] ligase
LFLLSGKDSTFGAMNTLFTGRHLIELTETASTNTHAIQLIKQGSVTEGTVVWAHFQSSGRGQYGNTWQAEKGKNLTFSLAIHPNFLAAEKQFYLSKITSLAVLGMLTEYLPASQYDIQIKWPNDILVNKDKIAGILIESILRGNLVQSSVIGLGLNVNQLCFEETKRKAISLSILLGKEFDLKTLLALFCKHFEALYLNLKQNKFDRLNKLYINNLYRFNEFADYKAGEKTFCAKLTGVEENGLLILKTKQNEILKFNFKEVEFLD